MSPNVVHYPPHMVEHHRHTMENAANDNQRILERGERCVGRTQEVRDRLRASIGEPPYVVVEVEELVGGHGVPSRIVTCVSHRNYTEGMRVIKRTSVASGSKSFVPYMKVPELSLEEYMGTGNA